MNSEPGSTAQREFELAQSSCAAGELPARAFFELTGADRQKFLHNFCTNDIKSLKPGEGCEAFMTSVQGKVLAHLTVQVAENSLWVEADLARREIVSKHFNKYLITEDVQIHDRSEDFRLILVCGPAMRQSLEGGGLTVSDASPMRHDHGLYRGVPVVWQQTRWSTLPNWTLKAAVKAAVEDADELLNALTTAGVALLSAAAIEALRIEGAYPRDGIDFTDANLAQEVARTDLCISFRKGCYLGQEPIARIDSMGHVNQELRRVMIEGSVPPHPGLQLVDSLSEKEAGALTSVSAFPVNGRWSGLAMLRRAFLAPATEIRTDQWSVRVEG